MNSKVNAAQRRTRGRFPLGYEVRNGRPKMRMSVVLFLDLLGYQQMVKDARTEAEQHKLLARLHRALKRHRGEVEPEDLSGEPIYEIRAFTDNVVIGWPIRDDGEYEIGNTLIKAACYQFALALEGFFVRGGLAIGPHFMDDHAVFGPALIEAYKIESELAVYPRVVLSETARKLVEHHVSYYAEVERSPQNKAILIDADGEWFLNYLDVAELDDSPDELLEYEPSVMRHRQRLIENLKRYGSNPRVFDKYSWAGRYHNYVCEYMYPSKSALLVPGKHLKQSFSRLSER